MARRPRPKPKIAALHRAHTTLAALAKREGVSDRFARFWARGERTSAKLDHAFQVLTRKAG
jgi:hypothetical protein